MIWCAGSNPFPVDWWRYLYFSILQVDKIMITVLHRRPIWKDREQNPYTHLVVLPDPLFFGEGVLHLIKGRVVVRSSTTTDSPTLRFISEPNVMIVLKLRRSCSMNSEIMINLLIFRCKSHITSSAQSVISSTVQRVVLFSILCVVSKVI